MRSSLKEKWFFKIYRVFLINGLIEYSEVKFFGSLKNEVIFEKKVAFNILTSFLIYGFIEYSDISIF